MPIHLRVLKYAPALIDIVICPQVFVITLSSPRHGSGLAQISYSNHYKWPHFLIFDITLLYHRISLPKFLWRCTATLSITSESFIKIWGGHFLRSIFTMVTTTLYILLMKPRHGVRKVTFKQKPRHWRIEKSRSNNSNVTATFKN